jgi:hypothetical protein
MNGGQPFPNLDPALMRAWNGRPLATDRPFLPQPDGLRSANGKPPIGEGEHQPAGFLDVVDLLAMDLPEPEFVVDYLFPKGALVLLTGDSGSTKTALALHTSFALILGRKVGDRFATMTDAKVLYLNGELETALLKLSVRQSIAGLGQKPADAPRARFRFENDTAFSELRLKFDFTGLDELARLDGMIRDFAPSLIIFDTQRALFDLDEMDTKQVVAAFHWLKTRAAKYGCCILVLHHLRKLGNVSNSPRERVSGARALITHADVHLHAIATNGQPMHALYIDKTRYAKDDVHQGVEFPVQANFAAPSSDPDASPAKKLGYSGFVISKPTQTEAIDSDSSALRDLLDRFEREGPLTANDVGAGKRGSGSTKRAWADAVSRGRIKATGTKKGRSGLWALAKPGHPGPPEPETTMESGFFDGPDD